MFKRRVKKLKAQSLIEIVMAIALAAFFMGITVLGLSLTSDKYLSYAEKKNALDLLKFQKSKNELNLGKFLADNKSLDGWSTLGAFPFQGAHQTFSYLNYNTGSTSTSYVLNEEKKFFANDTPLSYWSLDGVPTSSTYILDDQGRKALTGTLTCLGSPCNNPYVISPSLGRCVHNDCLQFAGDSNGGGVVTFTANTTIDNIKKITWEAWVYPTSVASDQMFLSKQGANYLRINNSKAYVSFNIAGTQRTLAGNTTLYNDTWYHIAATFDGSKIALYVNGLQDATPVSYSGDLDFNTGLMYWGLYTSADRRPFSGYMDEVRIYSSAVSSKEMLNHYNGFREQIGLLGYWHFDDALGIADYNDVTQVGTSPRFKTFSVPDNLSIDTTMVSAVNNEISCKEGSCLTFTGSYASKGVFSDSGNNYPLFHAPKKLTLEMWVKPSSVTGVQGLLAKDSANTFKVYLDGTSIVYSLKVGGTQYTETYAAGLSIGQSYLLDFTYDGTNMILYIDGVLKQSWTHSGTISDDTGYNDIYVGWTGSGTEYYNGTMDELRIYNRALSSDEINNRYLGAYTYYQYFKPLCRVSTGTGNDILDSECLNCVPTNGSECQTAKVHTALEPVLNKVWDMVKWGRGINYSKTDVRQVETPLMNWSWAPHWGTDWSGGLGTISGGACQEFIGIGQKGEYSAPEHSSCGSDDCGIEWNKVTDAKVCAKDNISFYSRQGCTSCGYADAQTPPPPGTFLEESGNKWCAVCSDNDYFRMTVPGSVYGDFISKTYSISVGHFGLLRFSWAGNSNTGKVKIQFACKEKITDTNGDLISEDSWEYLAPNPDHTTRCSSSYYYDMSLTPNVPFKPSTCWETDNLSLYNCKYFRYKVRLEPSGGSISPVVNSLKFLKGIYAQ